MERLLEVPMNSEASMREAIAFIRYEMLKAAIEGRELVLELWKDREPKKPRLEVIPSRQGQAVKLSQ